MAVEIPDSEPTTLRAGDTWKWTKSLPDYPASAWNLKYRFKSPTAGFEITADETGDEYSVTVTAATSSGYAAGTYSWIAWVEGGTSEKYTVDTGVAVINPDYRIGTATTALDDRSHARKTLAAIEAWIESRDQGVARYAIAGREMQYIPITDLLKLRQTYKAEVAAEDAAAALANGLGGGRRIQFRI